MFDIEDIVLEQQSNVLDTLIDLIDKNELFIESGLIDNDAYDDFVNEMFQMYVMEQTARNKQQKEIEKYVEDHGLNRRMDKYGETKKVDNSDKRNNRINERNWNKLRKAVKKEHGIDIGSTGDVSHLSNEEYNKVIQKDIQISPTYKSKAHGNQYKQNSKKVKRRMVNTLLQHDFDPKTETIRSDVKNPDGSYKRIKLNIHPGKNIIDDISHTENVATPWGSNYIGIGASTLHQKQTVALPTLHHELTHNDSTEKQRRVTGNPNNTVGYNTLNTNDNDPANKHIDEAKAKGMKIGSHDDSSYLNPEGKRNGEELYADLGGILKSRVKTAEWGNASSGPDYKEKLNEGTRPLYSDEVINMFRYLSNINKYLADDNTHILENLNNSKKTIYEVLGSKTMNEDQLHQIIDLTNRKLQNMEDVYSQKERTVENLKKQIEVYRKMVYNLKDSKIQNNEDIDYQKLIDNQIRVLEKEVKLMEDINEEVLYIYKLFNRENMEEYENINHLDRFTRTNVFRKIEPHLVDLSKDIDKEIPLAKKRIMQTFELSDGAKMRYEFVMKYANLKKRKHKNPGTPKSERLAKKQEKRKTKQEALNKKRGIIKEYFEEFFNEYYSLDWLFG